MKFNEFIDAYKKTLNSIKYSKQNKKTVLKKMKDISKKSLLLVLMISIFTILPIKVSAVDKPSLRIKNASQGVKLSWNKKQSKTYIVQRKSTNKKYKTIKVLSGKFSYIDKNVRSGRKYLYRVITNGIPSVEKRIIRLSKPVIKHIGQSDLEGVSVNWSRVKGAKKYEIYKAVVNNKTGGYKKLATVKTNNFSYTEKSGQKFKIKIRTVNGNYKSVFSKSQKHIHMEKVFVNTAINPTYDGINVDWDSIKGASEYYLYKASSKFNSFKKIATITNTNVIYTESGLKKYCCEYQDKDVIEGEKYKYYVTYKAGNSFSKKENVSEIVFKSYDLKIELNEGDIDNKTLDFSHDGDFDKLVSVKSSDENIVTVEKTESKKAVIYALAKGEAFIDIKYNTDYYDGYTSRYKIEIK